MKIRKIHVNTGSQHFSLYMKSTKNKPQGSGLSCYPAQG